MRRDPSLTGFMPVGPAECAAAEELAGSTASVSACPACAMPAAEVSVGPSTLPSALALPSACPWPSPAALSSVACPLLDGEEGGLGMGAARVSCMGAPACSASPLGSLMRSAKALSRACPRDSPAAQKEDVLYSERLRHLAGTVLARGRRRAGQRLSRH